MKTYSAFTGEIKNEFDDIDMEKLDDDVETLLQHLEIAGDDCERLQLESLSSVVSAISGALAIKAKSLLTKLKNENDAIKKHNILGDMILISTYGSMVSAAASVKNRSVLNKITKGRRV